MRRILAAAMAALGLAAAETGPPDIDLGGVDPALAGPPTRVLVLGTMHLSQFEAEIPTEDLSLLKDRLAAFAPDIIAIEAVTGQTCDLLDRYSDTYPGVWKRYCIDPEPALASLGMTAPEAELALLEALANLPERPRPEDRRRLAALYYAAGNPYSAVVQWLRLPERERVSGDGIDEVLREAIEARAVSRNENTQLGAVLAARLGHEQVHPMDDHSADAVLVKSEETLNGVLQKIWGQDVGGADAFREETMAALGSPEGVIEVYLGINSERMQRLAIANDFGLAAATPDENLVARHYLAWWQARGLKMAANVIEAAGNDPGAKVLVIVGSSHKPYFEAYLDQMHDIELVRVEDVLAGEGAKDRQ